MTTELKLNPVVFACKHLELNRTLHWVDWLNVLMTGN